MARRPNAKSGELFVESSGQFRIVDKSAQQQSMEACKVTCLGITFPSDAARRLHFTEELRERLRDPEFRKIEGFPKASDETILALSDPPYYTICPNPFLGEFAKHYGSPYAADEDEYRKTPFATDVSEGRYAPESLAHSYHTKVPARAIVRYILHYTKPGDVVLDGFCGSGMTAVAAQLCGTLSREARAEIERDVPDAVWGERVAIVADLAPAATFIAANYLHAPAVADLERECDDAIRAVSEATAWMFSTKVATSGRTAEARIDHTVWSDVFTCPECGAELVLWQLAVGKDGDIDKSHIVCPKCRTELRGADLARVQATRFDRMLGAVIARPKSVPVEISYSTRGTRGNKAPSKADLDLLQKIDETEPPRNVPALKMLFRDGVWGDMYRSGYHAGTTHFHHFYTTRNLHALASLKAAVLEPSVRWGASMLLTATAQKLSRMMRYMSDGIGRIQNGVLYFPSLFKESNPVHLLDIAKGQVLKLKNEVALRPEGVAITTSSASDLRGLPSDTVDYVFIDPPFGGNIMYSELNFLWEGWLGAFTNADPEAIVNRTQGKDFDAYSRLMARCFAEFRRVLKPGRWMTVEFHNSQNSVWNAIQQAIMEAGFIVADVRVLDKKQGTFKQVTTAAAVKKDLVISAYKPSTELERRFSLEAGSPDGVWDFVRTHLEWLPVFVEASAGRGEVVAERQAHLLFDRMVAFHVQRAVALPMSAAEFYEGLAQRFPQRDGMYFLTEQVAEYDRRRTSVAELQQLDIFVTDESSAIQWLRRELGKKPQTFQELHPRFMRELQSWAKHELNVELLALLEENFICFDGKGPVPPQIHAYLSSNIKDLRNREKTDAMLRERAAARWYVPDPSKQTDLEKLRERALLKEFAAYRDSKQRKLKQFRTEAVRAGFKAAYDSGDYRTIVAVSAKLPEAVLQEDEKLLMYYDVASMRLGED